MYVLFRAKQPLLGESFMKDYPITAATQNTFPPSNQHSNTLLTSSHAFKKKGYKNTIQLQKNVPVLFPQKCAIRITGEAFTTYAALQPARTLLSLLTTSSPILVLPLDVQINPRQTFRRIKSRRGMGESSLLK